jgi:Na+/H+-translocating membrane pyrophosphatase
MAISAANTGGAWDNAKKYIESGAMIDENGKKLLKELKFTKLQLLVIQSVIH